MRNIILFSFLIIFYSSLFPQNPPKYFAWLSDTHIGGNIGNEDLELSIADINSMDSIGFIIISGDITEYGSYQQLKKTKEILDKSNKPIYLVPGNHDTKWSESGATVFQTLWKDDRFVFDFEGIKFVGMHEGPRLRMGDGHWAPEDIRWLDSILSSIDKAMPLIFVTHYPIDKSITNWYVVLERLREYNIIGILCGHGHRNKVYDFEGIGGVMGRSNLRAKEQKGGFNIVRIFNESLSFFERKTGTKTLEYWHKSSFNNKKSNYVKEQKPDFSINEKNRKIYKLWKINTRFTIGSAAKVNGEKVFCGDASGYFYALNLSDGKELWKFKTNAAIYSTPDADKKVVVFASCDSFIYCLDVKNGNQIWKYSTKAPVVACPVIYNDVVYIGSSDKNFRAIDLKSGKLIWAFGGLNGFVESKPFVNKDKVIFGVWDSFLYCLDSKNGNLLWKWQGNKTANLLSPAACDPVVSGNKVFIVAPDRKMTAIDINTGQNIWRTDNFEVRESIGISKDSSKIYVRTINDTIYAISAKENYPKVIWATKLNNGYDINSAQLVEKDGVLFYPTKDGVLFALDTESGEILWRYRTGIALANTPAPINKYNVIITNFDGEIIRVSNDEENYNKNNIQK